MAESNSDMPIIREELLTEIEAAFDGMPRGNGITLHQATETGTGLDAIAKD